jgi:hypothetical protein
MLLEFRLEHIMQMYNFLHLALGIVFLEEMNVGCRLEGLPEFREVSSTFNIFPYQ